MKKGMNSLPIAKLVEADWNYKQDNEMTQRILANNIKKNGQIINIITRELDDGTHEVVNGNHRLKALRDIGAKDAVCFNLGNITLSEAKRIAIETNETNFKPSLYRLSSLIAEITRDVKYDLNVKYDFEKHTLPYSNEEIHRFKEISDIDLKKENKQPPDKLGAARVGTTTTPKKKKGIEETAPQVQTINCPHCGHNFEEHDDE